MADAAAIARERIAAKMKNAEGDAARKAKADADEAMTMQGKQASFRDMYRVEQTRVLFIAPAPLYRCF